MSIRRQAIPTRGAGACTAPPAAQFLLKQRFCELDSIGGPGDGDGSFGVGAWLFTAAVDKDFHAEELLHLDNNLATPADDGAD